MTAPAPTLSSSLEAAVALALAELADMWSLAPAVLAVTLMDVIPAAVDTFGIATAALAADWYDELRDHAEIAGNYRATVPPLDSRGGYELAGWAVQMLDGPEPNVEGARTRAEGGLQKRMANAANLTVTTATTEDPQARGYMRRTNVGACTFCVMVASRGGVYTRASSTFACHENCYCEAVPAWGGKARPVDDYKPSDRPQSAADRARVRKWIADNL